MSAENGNGKDSTQEQIAAFEKAKAYRDLPLSERFCPILSVATAGSGEKTRIIPPVGQAPTTESAFLMGCQGPACMFFAPVVADIQHPVTKETKKVVVSGQCAITQLAIQTAHGVAASAGIMELLARRARLKGLGHAVSD
jgi:hypothetical protein